MHNSKKIFIIVIWKHTVEAHIHCTTFQCCYIDTTASQHLFAALQAVTWDFPALKPKLAAWPKVTTAPYICPPASCLSPTVFFLGTVGVGAHFSWGRTPGSWSNGGWRTWRGSEWQHGVMVTFGPVRFLLNIAFPVNRRTLSFDWIWWPQGSWNVISLFRTTNCEVS